MVQSPIQPKKQDNRMSSVGVGVRGNREGGGEQNLKRGGGRQYSGGLHKIRGVCEVQTNYLNPTYILPQRTRISFYRTFISK